MQQDLNDIPIPDNLDRVVEDGLRQVRRLHRAKRVQFTGVICGCFVMLAAAFMVFGYSFPTVAAQIPLLGDLFRQRAVGNKISAGNAHVADYGVVESLEKPAQGTAGQCSLTIAEGYCDGNRLQLMLKLDTPKDFAGKFQSLYLDEKDSGSLTLNSQAVSYRISPLIHQNDSWTAMLEARVPDDLKAESTLQTALSLEGLLAVEVPREGVAFNETVGRQRFDGDFQAEFTVAVDSGNHFSFAAQAEDNEAKITAVSGTPIETVITLHKPFWGEISPLSEDAVMGIPQLLTMEGEELQLLYRESYEQGGYDACSRQPQDAKLYFDGLPPGTKQVVLRFNRDKMQREEVLAEFTVDLESQTVSPSKTYEQEGVLNLSNRYSYQGLSLDSSDFAQNGVMWMNCHRSRQPGEESLSLMLSLEEPLPERGWSLLLTDEQGNVLIQQDCIPGKENGWTLEDIPVDFIEDDQRFWLSVNTDGKDLPIAIGAVLTLKITELESDRPVFSEERVMEHPSYQ